MEVDADFESVCSDLSDYVSDDDEDDEDESDFFRESGKEQVHGVWLPLSIQSAVGRHDLQMIAEEDESESSGDDSGFGEIIGGHKHRHKKAPEPSPKAAESVKPEAVKAVTLFHAEEVAHVAEDPEEGASFKAGLGSFFRRPSSKKLTESLSLVEEAAKTEEAAEAATLFHAEEVAHVAEDPPGNPDSKPTAEEGASFRAGLGSFFRRPSSMKLAEPPKAAGGDSVREGDVVVSMGEIYDKAADAEQGSENTTNQVSSFENPMTLAKGVQDSEKAGNLLDKASADQQPKVDDATGAAGLNPAKRSFLNMFQTAKKKIALSHASKRPPATVNAVPEVPAPVEVSDATAEVSDAPAAEATAPAPTERRSISIELDPLE